MGGPVGGVGPERQSLSPSAVVARRRMSQGCRPVSESSNRPHSPLHRVASSSSKAEKAGKHGSSSPSRPATYELNHRGEVRKSTGSSSLRNNLSSSPTRLLSEGRLSIRAPGISLGGKPNPGPLHVGWMLDSGPPIAHNQSPKPPTFSGYSAMRP
jgi:hypothetical protein